MTNLKNHPTCSNLSNKASNLEPDKLNETPDKANGVKQTGQLIQTNEASAQLNPEVKIVVKWSNIEVEVNTQGKIKKILDKISGQTTNLEILAILGPSGSGKSTLLNTIAGRTANYKGSVKFYSNEKKIGFAYVRQVDQLSPYLTIRESLLYASKFKNPLDTDHLKEADFVIDSFNLNSVKNHFTTRCSGGERKRLSVALEMISKPAILLLDEPTTGLDSTTAFVIIEALKKFNKNTAVITTIHQPCTNLFNLFDRCLIMTNGRCIYSGSPTNIVDHLNTNFNLLCPRFSAPADFILDIANSTESELGSRLIEKMAEHEQSEWQKENDLGVLLVSKDDSNVFPKSTKLELREIDRLALKREHHFFREYRLNVMRMFLGCVRDPHQTIFRAMNNLNFPIILWLIMAYTPGTETGCAFVPLNETTIGYENAFKRFNRQLYGTRDVGSAFIDLMFCFFSAIIPSTVYFAQLFQLLRKEHMNAYYSPTSYLFAILTVNFFLTIIYACLNTLSYFYFTAEDVGDVNKLLKFGMLLFMTGLLGDLFGLFVSTIFNEHYITGIICGGFFAFCMFDIAGFFVPITIMTDFLKKISDFVFTRHLFEAQVRVLYGGFKCRVNDSVTFTFDHLVEFIRYFNYENRGGFQLQEIGVTNTKMKKALRQTTWNRSTITDLIVSVNDLDENQLKSFNDFWNLRTSYILNSFNLTHTDISQNVTALFITIGFAIFGCYSLLVYKLKK